jgi:hypothetical protein
MNACVVQIKLRLRGRSGAPELASAGALCEVSPPMRSVTPARRAPGSCAAPRGCDTGGALGAGR